MTAPRTIADADRAVAILQSGGVIALPTDTLYALAAAARDAAAVCRVYRIKGREDGKPLPLFVSSADMAEGIALLNDLSRRLASSFWPGPLTLVLPRRPEFVSEALAGGETVALRVPGHDLARSVVERLGGPITGTSANRSGGADPRTAGDVLRQLDGEVDGVIDGGACPLGVGSTIVDCTGAEIRLLRQGALSEARLREALAG